MIKCYWCGAENESHQERCHTCSRKLQWTTFFRGVLRPSFRYIAPVKRTQPAPQTSRPPASR